MMGVPTVEVIDVVAVLDRHVPAVGRVAMIVRGVWRAGRGHCWLLFDRSQQCNIE